MEACCDHKQDKTSSGLKKVVIVGSPNVGKSLLFNHFTGRYVTVANYPGTTVEVSRGKAKIDGVSFEVIDTPGIYSFSPLTEEEGVARRILFKEKPSLVIHLVDAKNLERLLPLTLQLIEAAFPTILVLNMMDEARRLRIGIHQKALTQDLGIPVLETVLTTGEGLKELKTAVRHLTGLEAESPSLRGTTVNYDGRAPVSLEGALARIGESLAGEYPISKRSLSLLLLKGDEEVRSLVKKQEPLVLEIAEALASELKNHLQAPLEFEIASSLKRRAARISENVCRTKKRSWRSDVRSGRWGEFLSRLTMNPLTGFPILFFVLYGGLYQFVGVFGAGTVVDFLEGTVFEGFLNPFFVKVFSRILPWPLLQDLFVGEYGMLTLGVRYAVALILPIVTFYFAVFAVIEDTGYLPRLAMLLDRTFKKIGLSGRAVIPMVLGFGCDTMATMVTRTLPTVRERIISTLLLSLAIPCSAQLGVIFAVLAGHDRALLLWAFVVGLVFLFIGFLTAQILPGERPSFYMELPPLRWPKISHVLTKTYVRVKWYFTEVLPLFIVASALIWLGQLTGLFGFLIRGLAVPVRAIGLPAEAASIFLMGFFRRDYGAAGLYDLVSKGRLDGVQMLVACVALTLFLPCIAQFLMNVKERGWKTGVGISIFILFFSFGFAFVLNQILVRLGAVL
ncbi:MAG: ferrous iron transport protein B [Candidatus Omnitrophica bacterium]|nr:ferrous iron transport protein B [Candidatus Omnitrophota bacterium]